MKKARNTISDAFAAFPMPSPRGKNNNNNEGIFGKELNEVMSEQYQQWPKTATSLPPPIPWAIQAAIEYLRGHATDTVGLFRISGSHEAILKLKQVLNTASLDKELEFPEDPLTCHVVAGVLKLFLRELPTPLLTFVLYDSLIALIDKEEELSEDKVGALDELLSSLPESNRHLLRELLLLLSEVMKYSETNCMTANNLATVIGPALLWPKPADTNSFDQSLQQLRSVSYIIKLTQFMIEHHNDLHSIYIPATVRPSSDDNLENTQIVAHQQQQLSKPTNSSYPRMSRANTQDENMLKKMKRRSRSLHELVTTKVDACSALLGGVTAPLVLPAGTSKKKFVSELDRDVEKPKDKGRTSTPRLSSSDDSKFEIEQLHSLLSREIGKDQMIDLNVWLGIPSTKDSQNGGSTEKKSVTAVNDDQTKTGSPSLTSAPNSKRSNVAVIRLRGNRTKSTDVRKAFAQFEEEVNEQNQ
jgi:hypothetical protein